MFAGVLNMRKILLIIRLLSPAFVRAERLPLKADFCLRSVWLIRVRHLLRSHDPQLLARRARPRS